MEKKRISDYRALARMTMKGHYGTMLGASVIVLVIQSLVSQIFGGLMKTASSTVMYGAYFVLLLLISYIIIAPIMIGLNGFFVRCISGEYDIKNVFRPFKTNLTNTVKIYFFMQLRLFLWLFIPWLIGIIILVAAVMALNAGTMASWLVGFADTFSNIVSGKADLVSSEALEVFFAVYFGLIGISFLFMIPGIIKSFEYAMIPYIAAENADVSVKEAFRRTKLMMNGNKLRYFGLSLSFIGWMLLGALALGIGMFFVVPYVYTATAHFYVDAKSRLGSEASFTDSTAEDYRNIDKDDSFGL